MSVFFNGFCFHFFWRVRVRVRVVRVRVRVRVCVCVCVCVCVLFVFECWWNQPFLESLWLAWPTPGVHLTRGALGRSLCHAHPASPL